ncbi:hypothetical protein UPYG_G00104810, partial [Umbra pygmaea]
MAAHTAHLNERERQRYLEKISILGSDPYMLPPVFFCPLLSAPGLPQLAFHDIYIYLVHNPSPYSGDSLKAFKSTDVYQYAVAGWVKDVKVRHLATKDLYLIMGNVHHSQALNTKPTWPWVVVQEEGTVATAHCTCMAGLGELHLSENQEVIPKKSAILSVVEGHSIRYMPKTVQLDMPPPLPTLYSSTRLELDLPPLLEEAARIFEELHLTEQCVLVEEKTREQRKSRVWFDQRAGRVTASAFHEAARTNNSSSLIKRVCYPQSSHFSTAATRWGLQNEDTARESYLKAMQELHVNFSITASGLIINPDLPWLGASPD